MNCLLLLIYHVDSNLWITDSGLEQKKRVFFLGKQTQGDGGSGVDMVGKTDMKIRVECHKCKVKRDDSF